MVIFTNLNELILNYTLAPQGVKFRIKVFKWLKFVAVLCYYLPIHYIFIY